MVLLNGPFSPWWVFQLWLFNVCAAASQLMTPLLHFAWREKAATAHVFKLSRWIWQLQSLDTALFYFTFIFFCTALLCKQVLRLFSSGLFSNSCSPTHLSTVTPDSQFEWVLFFQRCQYFISHAEPSFTGDSLPSTQACWVGRLFFPLVFACCLVSRNDALVIPFVMVAPRRRHHQPTHFAAQLDDDE